MQFRIIKPPRTFKVGDSDAPIQLSHVMDIELAQMNRVRLPPEMEVSLMFAGNRGDIMLRHQSMIGSYDLDTELV